MAELQQLQSVILLLSTIYLMENIEFNLDETTTLQPMLTSTNNPVQTSVNADQSSIESTIGPATSLSTIFNQTRETLPTFYIPRTCPNSTNTGRNCTTSGTLCDMLKPCKNNGTCNETDGGQGYNCSCSFGFNGSYCGVDHRPCKENTCWNNGTCTNTSDTPFNCACAPGWEGKHCETKFDYCHNITCQNRGVCRSLLLNYSCECLSGSYSGRHCENVAKRIVILKVVSQSFAYVAILAMASVALFVVIMDVLKYCFGIDPTREERERYRQEKQAKRRKPVIQRFIYVNAPPPPPPSKQPIPIIVETLV